MERNQAKALGKPFRRVQAVLGTGLVVVLGVCLALSFMAASPLEAAKACATNRGWRPDQLGPLNSHISNGPFGGSAHVNLNAQGTNTAQIIRVDLVRSAFSRSWRESGYAENVTKRE